MSSSRQPVLGIQITRHGGRDELDLVELEAPEPGEGEVLIRTVASSINPVDWKTREWDRGPSLPMVLGWDLAGIVTQSRSSRFAPGDRVIAMSGQISTGRARGARRSRCRPGCSLTRRGRCRSARRRRCRSPA